MRGLYHRKSLALRPVSGYFSPMENDLRKTNLPSLVSPGRPLGLGLLALWLLAGTAAAQTRYPPEADNSPLTAEVAAHLRDVAAAGRDAGRNPRRFLKAGDSITVNGSFFSQFKCVDHDPAVHYGWDWTRDLAAFGFLREAADYYRAEVVPGESNIPDAHAQGVPYPLTSFDRASQAAQVGQTAGWALAGDPSPLDAEIAALNPSVAFIMFGANDLGGYGEDGEVLDETLENELAIVDRCLGQGIVPVLSATCPKYTDDAGIERSRLFSHLVRAAAQARLIPFVNCHRALMPLPGHGLGDDNLHPTVLDYDRAAHLTEAGLACGHNRRNLVTLTALDQVYRAAVLGAEATDPSLPALAGAGTAADPFCVDLVPFADARATSAEAPFFLYRLDLALPIALRAAVTDQGATNADLRLLNAHLTELAFADRLLDRVLPAGTWYLRVEARGAAYGDFQLVLADRTDQGYPKDLDRDGRFTPADQRLLARFLAGTEDRLPGGAVSGDVNGGGVDATDLVELGKQFVAGPE